MASHTDNGDYVEGMYVPFTSPSEVVNDLVNNHAKVSDMWLRGVVAASTLLVLGIIGFVIIVDSLDKLIKQAFYY